MDTPFVAVISVVRPHRGTLPRMRVPDRTHRRDHRRHEVVSALTMAGQSTVWNGSASQRILVSPLEWQLRLT
jgi:hypothetical protein